MNLTQKFASIMRAQQPQIITISEVRTLNFPKRRARRLAYAWKGSRRGELYSKFLRGEGTGLVIFGNYLAPISKIGRLGMTSITTIHSVNMQATLARLQAAGYDPEHVPEVVLSRHIVPIVT